MNEVHGAVDPVHRSSAQGPWLSLNTSHRRMNLQLRFDCANGYASF
jgi:hypothetical protein